MGVPSLTSLIEENGFLLQSGTLKDTRVVLDGLSICHQLNHTRKGDARFGGDYEAFGSIVRKFFLQLRKAGVEPLLFFDGPLDREGLKKRTQLERMKQKIESAKSLSLGSGGSLLPLFSRQVLTDVCRDLSIRLICCPGEADQFLATAANTLACPLISQDSDFFIFDLPHGYIPFDSLNWTCSDPTKGIPCRYYFTRHLTEIVSGLDASILPLFAVLAGNDLSGPETFGTDLSPALFRGRRTPSRRKLQFNQRHEKLIALLEWLATHPNSETAIDAVLKKLPEKQRLQGREKLLSLTSLYECRSLDSLDEIIHRISGWLEKDSDRVPQWIHSLYHQGDVHVEIMRALYLKEIRFPPLVENFTRPSVWKDCEPLIQNLYTLLLQTQLGTTITEISRDKCNIAYRRVCPDEKSDEESASSPENPRELLCSLACIDSKNFPENLKGLELFALAISFWIRQFGVKKSIFIAVCLSAWSQNSTENDCFSKDFVPIPNFSKPQNRNQKGKKKQQQKNSNLNIEILHAIAQFQAVLQCFHWINTALQCPFDSTRLDRTFKGPLIYNLTRELQTKENNISKLFLSPDLQADFCDNLLNPMNILLGPVSFQDGEKRAKRDKTKTSKSKTKIDFDRRNSSDLEATEEPFRDAENIFTLLPQ